MEQSSFKKTSRRLVIELSIIVLATVGARLPQGMSYGNAWRYVGKHPLLIVHVAVGVLVVVEAVVLLVRSLRAPRQGLLIGLATAGTLFVTAAFIAGDRFLAIQQDSALSLMSLGWLAAIVSYAIGWYAGRRKRAAVLQA
jgi:hypothetical protein